MAIHLVGETIDAKRAHHRAQAGELTQLVRGVYVDSDSDIETEILGHAVRVASLSAKIREAKDSIRGRPHTFADSKVQSDIHRWRIDANEMMLDREESKRAARDGYLAAKQQREAEAAVAA